MEGKHLILDIDGTLVHTLYSVEQSPTNTIPDFENRVFKVFKRPHLNLFIQFCFDRFETVSIWTAASHDYAKYISDCIKPKGREFTFINSFEDCTLVSGESLNEFSCDVVMKKKLRKIWRRNKYKNIGITKDNTLIIEDTPSNCYDNYGNAIYVPEYNIFKSHDDTVLPRLQKYLEKLIPAATVRDIDKRNWL